MSFLSWEEVDLVILCTIAVIRLHLYFLLIRFSKMLFGAVVSPPFLLALRTSSSPLPPPYMYQQHWRECNKTKTKQAEMQATAVAQLLMILQGWSPHLLFTTKHLTPELLSVTGFLFSHSCAYSIFFCWGFSLSLLTLLFFASEHSSDRLDHIDHVLFLFSLRLSYLLFSLSN